MTNYQNSFPSVLLISDETAKKIAIGISKNKTGKPSPHKGKKLSHSHRENIRKSYWATKSKEETKDIRTKLTENGLKVMTVLQELGRAHRFTSESAKAIWTEEHRERIRFIITGMKRSDETKNKIRDNHWSKKSTQEVDNIIERISAKDSQLKNTEKGWFWSDKSNHNMFYMSSYEYRRLQFLENCKQVLWFSTKHDIRIPYMFENNMHIYILNIVVKLAQNFKTVEGYVRDEKKFEAKKFAAIKWCKTHDKNYSVLFEKDLESI